MMRQFTRLGLHALKIARARKENSWDASIVKMQGTPGSWGAGGDIQNALIKFRPTKTRQFVGAPG